MGADTECSSRPGKVDSDRPLRNLTRRNDIDANIIPWHYQSQMTDADRIGELWIGGQWKHLLCIG